MNLGTAKEKAIKFINEWSTNGSLTPAANNSDYTLRMNEFADTAQKKVATIKKIKASYQISQNPIPNLMGLLQGFDLKQFLPGTDYIITVKGAKSYYFEVDKQGSVYLEEETSPSVWTALKTVTVPSTVTTFTAYKANITPSNVNNNVRMRFTGSYPYNIRNTALYAYNFPTDNDVPDYRPYVKYTVPTDFMELKDVIMETDPRQYVNLADFKWENKRTFVVNYYYKGSFTIEYYKYPADITSSTLDSYDFEVDIEAQEAIPMFMAAMAVLDENATIATTLLNLYQGELVNIDGSNHKGIEFIENISGW